MLSCKRDAHPSSFFSPLKAQRHYTPTISRVWACNETPGVGECDELRQAERFRKGRRALALPRRTKVSRVIRSPSVKVTAGCCGMAILRFGSVYLLPKS